MIKDANDSKVESQYIAQLSFIPNFWIKNLVFNVPVLFSFRAALPAKLLRPSMSEIEVDVQVDAEIRPVIVGTLTLDQLIGVNGTDHVQVDPPALAVNLQPMWDNSGENSLEAILHRSLVVRTLNGKPKCRLTLS